MTSRLTVTTCQLSVAKAMASSAAATSEKMDAKHNVTALQKPMADGDAAFGVGGQQKQNSVDDGGTISSFECNNGK
jgi:hypothetical protein